MHACLRACMRLPPPQSTFLRVAWPPQIVTHVLRCLAERAGVKHAVFCITAPAPEGYSRSHRNQCPGT
eukprot:6187333-Alexandrium_andersonii.AAC.1